MVDPVERRLNIIEQLLNDDRPVHPLGCNCALKTRLAHVHAPDCPYRCMREVIAELREPDRTVGYEAQREVSK